MKALRIDILRVSPLTTIQDAGRAGYFGSGISASGPMDASAFAAGGKMLATEARSGIEFTTAGLGFRVAGAPVWAAFTGGAFTLTIDGREQPWNSAVQLAAGAEVDIRPGVEGNYGYVRFGAEIDVPQVLGSRATNLVVGLGGLDGRALQPGDRIVLRPAEAGMPADLPPTRPNADSDQPIRFVWGTHAERFSHETRQRFTELAFGISSRMDRMGVRLTDPASLFGGEQILSLVSDPVVPGDIQILGDGTPIVLMRDHQPTGGYPRIGTVVSADLDRFAQMRPGREVRFQPVSVSNARRLLLTREGQ